MLYDVRIRVPFFFALYRFFGILGSMAFLLSLVLLTIPPSIEGARVELQKIDQQIEKLSKERDLHAQRSQEYQREGDRWQYSTNNIDDAYKLWGKANDERRQVQDAQLQIEALKEQRDRIYQYYPQLYPK